MDKTAFYTLNYGVYIISTKDAKGEYKYAGCVANTFQQITSDPPQVCVTLNKENYTTQCILEAKEFGATVLSEKADMELIGTFGFHTSKETNKFEKVSYKINDDDIPAVTQDASAIFYVSVEKTVDVGTHIMFIGDVKDAEVVSDETPMTYNYYHNVLRGKTPPKASTYNGGDDSASADNDIDAKDGDKAKIGKKRYGWRCTVCGYITEVDELPPDFTCPICGAPRDKFERIELD